MGSQQDVTDAANAKSIVLDHNAMKKLVNLEDGIQCTRKRLNEQRNKLVKHTSKLRKLETNVEFVKQGNIS